MQEENISEKENKFKKCFSNYNGKGQYDRRYADNTNQGGYDCNIIR